MIFLFVGGVNGGRYEDIRGAKKKKYNVKFFNPHTELEETETYVIYKTKYLVLETLSRLDIEKEISAIERTLPECRVCNKKVDAMITERSNLYEATYYISLCHGKKHKITITDDDVKKAIIPSFEFAF